MRTTHGTSSFPRKQSGDAPSGGKPIADADRSSECLTHFASFGFLASLGLLTSLGFLTSFGFLASLGLLASLCMGCHSGDASSGQGADANRSRYLLTSAPENPLSIAQAKALDDLGESIFVIGRINAGQHNPFEDGKAMFLMQGDPAATMEPSPEESSHDAPGHDPSTCPFCKKRNGQAPEVAIVTFCDADAKPIATDARELLGVAKDQVVVVHGIASIDPIGNLMIKATGLYIVR